MLEELVYKLYKVTLMEGFIWVMINLLPWVIFGILKAVSRIMKKNEIYSDVHKSGRVKDILFPSTNNLQFLGSCILHLHWIMLNFPKSTN